MTRVLDDGYSRMDSAAPVSQRRGNGPSRPADGPPDFATQVADTNVDAVLAKVRDGEWDRGEVVAAERAGKGRSGILDQLDRGATTGDDG